MAGGDDNRSSGLFLQHAETYYRSRRGFRAKIGLYPVTGRYLGGSRGEVFRGKAGIIADNQTLPRQTGTFQVVRHRLGADSHVIECKVPGDNSPPAVGTEFNGIIFQSYPLYPLSFDKGKGKFFRRGTSSLLTPFSRHSRLVCRFRKICPVFDAGAEIR